MVIGADGTRGRSLLVGAQGGAWELDGPGGERLVLERCEPSRDWAVGGAGGGSGGTFAGASRVDGDALLMFFETRVLERRLAGKIGSGTGLGSGHVVGVRDLGADDKGGYAVRDRYAFSLGDLIRTGTAPAEHVLHEIVGGLLGGLGAIETYGTRPHGDLDADAVLVGDVRPRKVRVGLRGVVPERLLGRDLEEVRRDELRRVGLLIHHMVTGRAFRELGGYPVRPGAAWERLGKNGEFWRGLVNELLDPKTSRLSLGEVKARVDQLPYRAPKNRHTRTVAASVVVGVLWAGGAAAFFLIPRGGGGTPEFERAAFDEWVRVTPVVRVLRDSLDDFGSETLETELTELLGTEGEGDLFDPVGRGRLKEVTDKWRLLGDSGFDLDDLKGRVELLQRTREEGGEVDGDHEDAIALLAAVAPDAVERAGKIGGVFGAETWGALGRLEAWAIGFEERGWTRAAGLLRERVADAEAAAESLKALLASGGGEGTEQVGDEEAPTGVAPVIRELVRSVSEVERLSERGLGGEGRIGWDTKSLDGLSLAADVLAERAALPGADVYGPWLRETHGPLPARDPALASLPAMVSAAGVLEGDSGLDEFDARLSRVRQEIERAGREAAEGWTARVDLVALRDRLDWYGDAEPMGEGAAGDLGLWRSRVGEWVRAAGESRGDASAGRAERVAGLLADADEIEEVWIRVEGVDRARWEPVAAERFGVDRYGGEARASLARVRGVAERASAAPGWPSIAGTVDGALNSARDELDRLDSAVDGVAAVVLKTPGQLIEEWRADASIGALVEGAGWLAPVVSLRDEVGNGGVIRRWEAWREANSGLSEDEVAGSEAADGLRRGLAAIDDVLGRVPGRIDSAVEGVAVGGGFDDGAIRPRVRSEMVSAVVSALGVLGSDWEADDAGDAGGLIDGVVAEAIAGVERRVAAMNADLDTLGAVVDGLIALELPGDDGLPGAAEIDGVLGRLETEHAGFLPARPGGVGSVVDRSDAGEAAALAGWVVGVGREQSPAALLGLFVENDAPAVVRYAAGVRLGEVGTAGVWPGPVGSMEADAGLLGEGLTGLSALLGSGDGRAARVERLRGVVFAWWVRGFDGARSEGDMRELVERAPGWFDALAPEWDGMLDAGRLGGAAAYDAAVLAARDRMAAEIGRIKTQSRGVTRDRSIALGNELAATIRGEIEGLRQAAQGIGRTGWLDDLTAVLNENAGGASWDPGQNGPGRALGWRGTLLDQQDPPAVEYSSGGSDPVTLRFSLVQAGGGQVFLAEEEFSVGALAALVASAKREGKWASPEAGVLKSWFDRDTSVQLGDRVGPQGYSILYRTRGNVVRIRATDVWEENGNIGRGENQAPAYPDALLDNAGDNPRANRMRAELQPSMEHPLTRVPADAAEAIAGLAGCRLPSAAAYEAAIRAVPSPGAGVWNLSDETVAEQRRHVSNVTGGPGQPTSLYAVGTDGYASSGNDTEVWPTDDNVLWYRRVSEQPGGVLFKNIVGNAGEWIDGASAVIGGSAMSRPDQNPSASVALGRGQSVFVDVGLRLAIPADEFGSLATALERELESARSAAYSFGGG